MNHKRLRRQLTGGHRCFDSNTIAKLDPKFSSQGWYGSGPQKAAKENSAQSSAPTLSVSGIDSPSTTVGNSTTSKNIQNGNIGRAALVSTSPSGVLGTDPTGRRKLLGN